MPKIAKKCNNKDYHSKLVNKFDIKYILHTYVHIMYIHMYILCRYVCTYTICTYLCTYIHMSVHTVHTVESVLSWMTYSPADNNFKHTNSSISSKLRCRNTTCCARMPSNDRLLSSISLRACKGIHH